MPRQFIPRALMPAQRPPNQRPAQYAAPQQAAAGIGKHSVFDGPRKALHPGAPILRQYST